MTMKFYKVKEGTSYHKALLDSIKGESKMLEIVEQVRKEFGLAESSQYSISPNTFFKMKLPKNKVNGLKKMEQLRKMELSLNIINSY